MPQKIVEHSPVGQNIIYALSITYSAGAHGQTSIAIKYNYHPPFNPSRLDGGDKPIKLVDTKESSKTGIESTRKVK